jgi:hypothetical protein
MCDEEKEGHSQASPSGRPVSSFSSTDACMRVNTLMVFSQPDQRQRSASENGFASLETTGNEEGTPNTNEETLGLTLPRQNSPVGGRTTPFAETGIGQDVDQNLQVDPSLSCCLACC